MADEHRHAHARRADREVRQLEDLAGLGAELRLLVRLVALPRPVHHQVVLGRRLRAKLLHPLRAGAGDGLVRRDVHPLQGHDVVQRLQHAGERDRAAVRVRHDPVALERLERAGRVHLGHDERIPVDEPVGGGLVDADRTGGRGDRNELATRARPDREQEEVDVPRRERLGRRLLDEDLVVAERQARAGRARRGERAHVVAALGEQLECDRADRARGADDTDARCGHGGSVEKVAKPGRQAEARRRRSPQLTP